MTLDKATAARIEELLSEIFGGFYDGFEHYVTQPCQWGHEWRFGGQLGFGGKFHMVDGFRPRMYVSCYPEDQTPERLVLIATVNAELAKLAPPGAAA
jgi:hypothetical protein